MKKLLPFLLLIIVALPSIFSLLQPGFFQSDDGEWMIIRFSAFHQALADGQFPVRFLGRLNNGYGYPVTSFLYPGFMYLSEPLKILGFGFVGSIKIILGLSMIGSALFVYFWLSKFFNKASSFIGSLFYLYIPYHLFDLYKRGSVGEILALAIVPFILWQIERKSFFWASIGIGFLILSHNTLAVLFFTIIIIYLLLRKNFMIPNSLFLILISMGLSAFFWIPAVLELQYVNFSQVSVSDYKQYFATFELIGAVAIFILSFATVSIYDLFRVQPLNEAKKGIDRVEPLTRIFLLMVILSFFSIFFSSKTSFFLWAYIPSSFIQFPFRLLSYLPLSLAFISAFIIFQLRNKRKIIISLVFLVILGVSTFPYLKPSEFFNKEEGFYATNEGTTTVQDEYMPKWVKQKPTEHFKEKVEIISGVGKANNVIYNSKNISFNLNSQTDSKIRINTIYYPGWKAFVDGKESTINYQNEQGVMEVLVPKGTHSINLSFSETPLRLFADFLSVLSVGGLLTFSFLRRPRS